MPGVILAAISPDNTPHGYNWTFAFPMLLFIVVVLVLYALFSRPHRRIPARPISATPSGSRVPDAQTTRAAAVAGGTAPGGGTTESASEPAGATMTGSVNPQDLDSSDAGKQSQEGTEASE